MRGFTEDKLNCMLKDALRSEVLDWKPLSLSRDIKYDDQTAAQVYETSLRWLLELNCKLRCYPECFCLAVSLLRRFLGCVKVQPRHVNCAAVACFVLAIKLTEEDTEVPGIDYIVQTMISTSHGISKLTVSEVVRMEAIVLDKLSWNVNPITALHFLQILHAMATRPQSQLTPPRPAAEATAVAERHPAPGGSPARQLATASAKLMRFLCSADACGLKPSVVALSLLCLELVAATTTTTPPSALLSPVTSPDQLSAAATRRRLCVAVGAAPDELERGLELVTVALYRQRRPPTCATAAASGGGGGSSSSSKLCKRKCVQGDGNDDHADYAGQDLKSSAVGTGDGVTEQYKDEP